MKDILAALEQVGESPCRTLVVSEQTRYAMLKEALNLGADYWPPNPLKAGAAKQTFMGFNVEVADIPPETVYDWSGCRSPARARRRLKRGFPQRVKITTKSVGYLINAEDMQRTDDWVRRASKIMVG